MNERLMTISESDSEFYESFDLLKYEGRKSKKTRLYHLYVHIRNICRYSRNCIKTITRIDGRNWRQAMEYEMQSFKQNDSWKLVNLPGNRRIVDVSGSMK